MGMCRLDASDSGRGPAVGSCEHGYERSGTIKGGKFLLLEKDSAPWSWLVS
jgi:hypothetical protein